jgi:hypothetical protein
MTDATSDPDPTPEAEEPQPFENRAARRSKGKAASKQTGNPTGRVQARPGTVQSPRQYGNRRSG